MTNEIMETTNNKTLVNFNNFKNATLKEYTERIYNIGEQVKKYSYEVAKIISDVDANKYYQEDGFKTVHAWTETMFGYKKSASYNLLTVGNSLIKEVAVDEQGNKEYCSIFSDGEHDFTMTQLVRLLPLVKENGTNYVKQLLVSGMIDFDSSANKISEVIKALKAPEQKQEEQATEEQATEEQEQEQEQEQATEEQAQEEIVTITWKKRKFAFPRSILEKYEVK